MNLLRQQALTTSKNSSWPRLASSGQPVAMIQWQSATITLWTLFHKVATPSSDCGLGDLHHELSPWQGIATAGIYQEKRIATRAFSQIFLTVINWISFCSANSTDIHHHELRATSQKTTRRSKTPSLSSPRWTYMFISFAQHLEHYSQLSIVAILNCNFYVDKVLRSFSKNYILLYI